MGSKNGQHFADDIFKYILYLENADDIANINKERKTQTIHDWQNEV